MEYFTLMLYNEEGYLYTYNLLIIQHRCKAIKLLGLRENRHKIKEPSSSSQPWSRDFFWTLKVAISICLQQFRTGICWSSVTFELKHFCPKSLKSFNIGIVKMCSERKHCSLGHFPTTFISSIHLRKQQANHASHPFATHTNKQPTSSQHSAATTYPFHSLVS